MQRERACSTAKSPLTEMGFQVAQRPVWNIAKRWLLVQISPKEMWLRQSAEKRFASLSSPCILAQLWQIPGRSLLTPGEFLSIATLGCQMQRCAQWWGRHKAALISGGQESVRRGSYCKPLSGGENAFVRGQVLFFWMHIDEKSALFPDKFYLMCYKMVCWYSPNYLVCLDFFCWNHPHYLLNFRYYHR